ncbi:N-acetylmuramoyl-L-alanine amidase [uncultured Eudoraea sp.]|uniref:N-acetylmuramoyl-L-alanine amidase family protein n=1 Tax=uncultured Eudoraea sp. TaxID=1035614 RepID=UPI003458E29E
MPLNYIRLFMVVLWIPLSAAMAQDSLNTVIAEKGDGIYSLLRKQGVDPYMTYDDFIALNENRLRDSLHLYEGMSYIIPEIAVDSAEILKESEKSVIVKESPKANTYDIFGKQYAEFSDKSERLKETVFYLISGHGGPDPGAMTQYMGKSISEDEYAYDVTLRLARELLSHGAQVYIIVRDPDDGIRDDLILEMDKDEIVLPDLSIPLDQKDRLEQRVNAVNNLYKKHKGKHQRLIVTHVDSRSKGQNIDVFFYYHEKSKRGKKLAESIHNTFKNKYKKFQPNRSYSGTFEDRSNLYLVKKTLPAMTFIEIGNIRNKKDQRRILDYDNRQALAKWISEGVILDYETK